MNTDKCSYREVVFLLGGQNRQGSLPACHERSTPLPLSGSSPRETDWTDQFSSSCWPTLRPTVWLTPLTSVRRRLRPHLARLSQTHLNPTPLPLPTPPSNHLLSLSLSIIDPCHFHVTFMCAPYIYVNDTSFDQMRMRTKAKWQTPA